MVTESVFRSVDLVRTCAIWLRCDGTTRLSCYYADCLMRKTHDIPSRSYGKQCYDFHHQNLLPYNVEHPFLQ